MTSWFLLRALQSCIRWSTAANTPKATAPRLVWRPFLTEHQRIFTVQQVGVAAAHKHPREEKAPGWAARVRGRRYSGIPQRDKVAHDKRLSQHLEHEDLARRPSRSLVLFGSRAVHTTIAVFSKLVSRLAGDFRGGVSSLEQGLEARTTSFAARSCFVYASEPSDHGPLHSAAANFASPLNSRARGPRPGGGTRSDTLATVGFASDFRGPGEQVFGGAMNSSIGRDVSGPNAFCAA